MKIRCVWDENNCDWCAIDNKDQMYLVLRDIVYPSNDEGREDDANSMANEEEGADSGSNVDYDSTSSNDCPKNKVWPLFEFPQMTCSKAIRLDVAQGSKAFVCANKKVVIVDSINWNVFLVDLVVGECSRLPGLSPVDYMASAVPPGLPDIIASLDGSDSQLFSQCMSNCMLYSGWCPTNETPITEFIVKFVMSDVLKDANHSILIAMLNPKVCIDETKWGEKLLAYIAHDEGEEASNWTPIFAFAPHWIDGVFHKSEFLLLTPPWPYVVRAFSFQGVCPGKQPQVMKKVALDPSVERSLGYDYCIEHLALINDKVCLVSCYMNGGDAFTRHRDKDVVKVYRLSYPDTFPDSDPDREFSSDAVYNAEITADLGGKALFVGDIASFSIEVDIEVDSTGFIQPDSVYFTPRDNERGEYRLPETMLPLGFFNLKSKKGLVLPWDDDYYPGKLPLFV